MLAILAVEPFQDLKLLLCWCERRGGRLLGICVVCSGCLQGLAGHYRKDIIRTCLLFHSKNFFLYEVGGPCLPETPGKAHSTDWLVPFIGSLFLSSFAAGLINE